MSLFDDNKLYSAEEVRKLLKLGHASYRNLCNDGKIPYMQISERNRRHAGKDMNEFLAGQYAK